MKSKIFSLKHGFQLLGVWLILGFLVCSCDTSRVIVTDLSEREANHIIVFLANYNIDAEKSSQATGGPGAGDTTSKWSISVPGDQRIEALAQLNRAGLPRRPTQSLLTLFAKSGLVSSATEEQIRYQEGLSSQIAGTIRQIDGVVDATVQVSFPQAEGVEETEEPVRASVYVKHSGILDDPNSQLITKIKRLVSGSITGLTLDNVTVVSDRARFTDIPPEDEGDFMEKGFTKVWSVSVANQSVSRFQTIFFILSLVILALAGFLSWMVWKLFPLMQGAGGLQGLFTNLRPMTPQPPTEEEPTEGEEE